MAKKDIVLPYADGNRRTCIVADRANGVVKFIMINVESGLEVEQLGEEEFDQRFTLLSHYPPAQACSLFKGYSLGCGATKEVLDCLGLVINVTKEEVEMATSKKAARGAVAATKVAAAKTVKAKPAKTPKADAAPKAPRVAGQSAAAMFKELIMRGTMTDDQIFAKVKEKHGLDDNKRSYVTWYRNSLKKAGEKPPEAKK